MALTARIPVRTVPVPPRSEAGIARCEISIRLFACLARYAFATIAVFACGANDTFAARLLGLMLAIWFLAR